MLRGSDIRRIPRSSTGPGLPHNLTAKDGATWEVKSDSIKLDDHVGHTVQVTGVVAHHKEHAIKEDAKAEMKEHDMDKDAQGAWPHEGHAFHQVQRKLPEIKTHRRRLHNVDSCLDRVGIAGGFHRQQDPEQKLHTAKPPHLATPLRHRPHTSPPSRVS